MSMDFCQISSGKVSKDPKVFGAELMAPFVVYAALFTSPWTILYLDKISFLNFLT